MKVCGPLAGLILFTCASAAVAATPQDLYASGKYAAAMDAGAAENSAMGLAVAAHAALADATIRSPCLDCIKRAEGFARRAIALDDKLPDGHMYLAVALGYEARIVGAIAAKLNKLPEESRRNLDAALAADPGNARALAALGGWNIAVVSNGGATLARWIYGASLSDGEAYFARAFRLAPQDIALRYQYALSLSAYDARTYREKIVSSLTNVVNGHPATAYDSLTQTRARDLLHVLKSGDFESYRQLVRRYQGYP